MSEPRPDDRPAPPSGPDAGNDEPAGAPYVDVPADAARPAEVGSPASDVPAGAGGQDVQRRAFLRQLTGEAVVTTARLAGLSAVVRRTIYAAGEAATRELDPATAVEPAGAPGTEGPAPAGPTGATPALAAPPPGPAVTVTLTSRQEAMLAAAPTAVLAVNDRAGAPHLTSSAFHWDGTVVRLPSELLSARVAGIDADPHVSILVEEGPSGGWVAITGLATVVSGDAVEPEMLTILRKSLSEDDAERRWAELRSDGQPVVIVVRPDRFVWRLA